MDIYTVYKKYNKDFVVFARSITHNEELALDLVQDAYIRGLEREEIFGAMNEHQIKGWFFMVIKNRYIDSIRKYNRIIPWKLDETLEVVEDFEEEVVFEDLLNRLPLRNREVIYLRYKLCLNSNEIGKILGIPASTVRSRLSASIKLLKNIL